MKSIEREQTTQWEQPNRTRSRTSFCFSEKAMSAVETPLRYRTHFRSLHSHATAPPHSLPLHIFISAGDHRRVAGTRTPSRHISRQILFEPFLVRAAPFGRLISPERQILLGPAPFGRLIWRSAGFFVFEAAICFSFFKRIATRRLVWEIWRPTSFRNALTCVRIICKLTKCVLRSFRSSKAAPIASS